MDNSNGKQKQVVKKPKKGKGDEKTLAGLKKSFTDNRELIEDEAAGNDGGEEGYAGELSLKRKASGNSVPESALKESALKPTNLLHEESGRIATSRTSSPTNDSEVDYDEEVNYGDADNEQWEEGPEAISPLGPEFADSITSNPDYKQFLFYPSTCKSAALRKAYVETLTWPLREWRRGHHTIAEQMCPGLIVIKTVEESMLELYEVHSAKRLKPLEPVDSMNTYGNQSTNSHATLRHETFRNPKFPAEPTPQAIRSFKKEVEEYELSGNYTFNRDRSIAAQEQLVIQTMFDSANVDQNVREHWRNEHLVSTQAWLNCLLKLVDGGVSGASDTEAFRLELAKNPITINMTNPVQTAVQVAKWTVDYKSYDISVSGNISEQERKNQLNSLEKSMRLLNEGPEARAEMAQFFTTLKNEKTTFINALQKIAALHWDVNNAAVKTKRWFNLAKLMHESDGEKTNPRTHNRPDDKSIGFLKPQPASSLLGSASKQALTPRDASSRAVGDVKSTHGQKPMTTPPLKWTDHFVIY